MGFFSDLEADSVKEKKKFRTVPPEQVNMPQSEPEPEETDEVVEEVEETTASAATPPVNTAVEPDEEPEDKEEAADDEEDEAEDEEEQDQSDEAPVPAVSTAEPDIPNAEEGKSDEVGVISPGMIIQGNITSRGSVEVLGTVSGNINILGKLDISGEVKGDSKASEVCLSAGKVFGNITAPDGEVTIKESTVLIGDINAGDLTVFGAVKGNIDVKGTVNLQSGAIIMGDIRSKSLQIDKGAAVEGMCSQCYADVSPAAFFK